jgi:hypothetical protein
MKKLILLIVILSCASLVFAQKYQVNQTKPSSTNPENRKVLYGLSFGPTIDWFAPTSNLFSLKRNKAKAGLVAGVDVDFNLITNNLLYFSTGVMFRYLQGELSFENQYDFSPVNPSLITPTVRTYQTMYITIPTGVTFRTAPSKNCVFAGKLGLYHNFNIGGNQFDQFTISGTGLALHPNYYITTSKIKNNDASLFAESGYVGLGFEYVFAPRIRVTANVEYSCQFNYFSSKALHYENGDRFKTIVHSLHIVFGVLF